MSRLPSSGCTKVFSGESQVSLSTSNFPTKFFFFPCVSAQSRTSDDPRYSSGMARQDAHACGLTKKNSRYFRPPPKCLDAFGTEPHPIFYCSPPSMCHRCKLKTKFLPAQLPSSKCPSTSQTTTAMPQLPTDCQSTPPRYHE